MALAHELVSKLSKSRTKVLVNIVPGTYFFGNCQIQGASVVLTMSQLRPGLWNNSFTSISLEAWPPAYGVPAATVIKVTGRAMRLDLILRSPRETFIAVETVKKS